MCLGDSSQASASSSSPARQVRPDGRQASTWASSTRKAPADSPRVRSAARASQTFIARLLDRATRRGELGARRAQQLLSSLLLDVPCHSTGCVPVGGDGSGGELETRTPVANLTGGQLAAFVMSGLRRCDSLSWVVAC